jgi:DNA repair protein RecO (recombination protein O)
VDEKTTGIILRTRPLTETSLIVHWLTPEFGRIATVAKGALRAKSPFRGKLDLFFLADISFARSRRSELHTLRELSVREMHATLRRELGWLEQAAYATELIELTTETDTPLPELFALFRDFLDQLPRTPPQPQTVFAFEMKLLRELGQAPDISASQLNAGTKQILQKLTELDWPALSRLKPNAEQVREAQQFLHGFLSHHLGRIPKGRIA